MTQFQNPHARFVVDVGNDRFDVIAGYKLNTEALTLAEANVLARRSSASLVSICGNLVNGTVVHHGERLPLGDDCDLRRRREMS